jgi:hypothetical protein
VLHHSSRCDSGAMPTAWGGHANSMKAWPLRAVAMAPLGEIAVQLKSAVNSVSLRSAIPHDHPLALSAVPPPPIIRKTIRTSFQSPRLRPPTSDL